MIAFYTRDSCARFIGSHIIITRIAYGIAACTYTIGRTGISNLALDDRTVYGI